MKPYCVVDLETSGTTTFKRFCNPLDPRHSITLIASCVQGPRTTVYSNPDSYKDGITSDDVSKYVPFQSYSFLAGQNFKYDMLWFWDNKEFQQWLKDGGTVWDTQTVEYLLMGQNNDKRNLDSLALKYGGILKDDRIGVLYKSGLQSKDIAPELLIPYAEGDVENTNKVLQGQAKAAQKQGQLPLIKAYMDHYLAITEMEYNGLYFDIELAKKKAAALRLRVDDTRQKLIEAAYSVDFPTKVEFNPSSVDHISALLFGGEVKIVVDMPILNENGEETVYKTGLRTGQIRTKKTKITIEMKGLGIDPTGHSKKSARGYYSTQDRVVQRLLLQEHSARATEVLHLLSKYRELMKLLTTYYYGEKKNAKGEITDRTGMIAMVHPHTGCVHSEFKSALTATGRLSSRTPNIQNLAPDTLELFKSRYGDEGVIVEFDYSQLEVVVQAYIAQCPQMLQDIENGVDFHCKRLAYAENMDYDKVVALCATSAEWKLKRKKAKIISFQKAYGAQPAKIAESSGLPIEVVERVFQKEDEEYPEIKAFYADVMEQVERSRKCTSDLLKIRQKSTGERIELAGEYKGYGQYQSITGKIYTFYENAVLTRFGKVFRYFSIPDIQDYPIQGTAADIVASQVGKVFRWGINHRDKFLMVNEVHDSLILDVRKEHLDFVIENVKGILEDVDNSFQESFGCRFNAPIKVDYGYGSTWAAAKEESE